MRQSWIASSPILPGRTLGVLGGGQLGRMLAQEARHRDNGTDIGWSWWRRRCGDRGSGRRRLIRAAARTGLED